MTTPATSRQRSPLLIWWAVGSVVLALLGMFAGYTLRGDERQLTDTEEAPVQALTTVESRSLSTSVVLTGTFQLGDTIHVPAPALDGSRIVTQSPREPGDTVQSGTVIAAVSGRPLFALRTDFSFYRDLMPGDAGDDVDQLHTALRDLGYGAPRSGSFSSATSQALRSFYSDRGYTVPDRNAESAASTDSDGSATDEEDTPGTSPAPVPYLPAHEFFALPHDQLTVISTAQRGTDLSDDDATAAQLRFGTPQVTAHALVSDIDALHDLADADYEFSVIVPESSVTPTAVIQSIGEFSENESDENPVPGYPVTLGIVDDTTLDSVEDGATVTVTATLTQETAGLSVQVLAVRDDADGAYVLVTDAGEPPYDDTRRCSVELGETADGFTAITPVDECVQEGDSVVVG